MEKATFTRDERQEPWRELLNGASITTALNASTTRTAGNN
jgi:hypothetical protein